MQQQVKVHTQVTHAENRFGIDQNHIDSFIAQLLRLEVDGRHFRTKYQIEMATGAPQAENFLWTILGNKVRNYNYNSIVTVLFRKQKKQGIDLDTVNLRRSIRINSQNWLLRWKSVM